MCSQLVRMDNIHQPKVDGVIKLIPDLLNVKCNIGCDRALTELQSNQAVRVFYKLHLSPK